MQKSDFKEHISRNGQPRLSVRGKRPTRADDGRSNEVTKGGKPMTMQEFTEKTCDYLVAWFEDLYLLIREDRKDKKIEPLQKRQLIATAQSLLHDVQDYLESEQKAL